MATTVESRWSAATAGGSPGEARVTTGELRDVIAAVSTSGNLGSELQMAQTLLGEARGYLYDVTGEGMPGLHRRDGTTPASPSSNPAVLRANIAMAERLVHALEREAARAPQVPLEPPPLRPR